MKDTGKKEEIELVEMAWSINSDNLEENFLYSDDTVVYGTRGQAKSKLLIDNDAATLLKTAELIDFKTIRIKRNHQYDVVLYKGNKMLRYEIAKNDREGMIAQLDKTKFYYVQDSRSYVGNAILWWAIDGKGYVTDLAKAHKYSWEEIQSFIGGRSTDVIWEAEHVEGAIRKYVDAQYLDGKYRT